MDLRLKTHTALPKVPTSCRRFLTSGVPNQLYGRFGRHRERSALSLKATDRSYVIHEGKVISDGTPHELINDPKVRESYLGDTFKGDEFDRQPSRVGAD